MLTFESSMSVMLWAATRGKSSIHCMSIVLLTTALSTPESSRSKYEKPSTPSPKTSSFGVYLTWPPKPSTDCPTAMMGMPDGTDESTPFVGSWIMTGCMRSAELVVPPSGSSSCGCSVGEQSDP